VETKWQESFRPDRKRVGARAAKKTSQLSPCHTNKQVIRKKKEKRRESGAAKYIKADKKQKEKVT